jgi:hypothetical protein
LNQNSVNILTVISPNTLRTCSENNRLKTIKTKKSRAFYPVTQKQYQESPASITAQAKSEPKQLNAKPEDRATGRAGPGSFAELCCRERETA